MYYINPKTGRTIKKDGKIFNELSSKRYKIDKDPCFYNESSAKRCLGRLMHYYPDLHLPDINVHNNVTVIRNKKGKVHGLLSNKGNIYKLSEPLDVSKNVPELKTVSDKHAEILNKQLNESPIIQSNEIKDKLKNKQGENVVYNPLYNNYITISNSDTLNRKTLNKLNSSLIPNTLPIIPGTNISGLIQNENNEIAGYITATNEAKQFSQVLKLKVDDLQTQLKDKESQINKLKEELLTSNNIPELNKKIIQLENEKEEIRQYSDKRINDLLIQLQKLNVQSSELKFQKESVEYYYSLIKDTLEAWHPVEDDAEKYKSYGQWLKDLFLGTRPLKKTDNIEYNLQDLVQRANQYANARRSNVEHVKYIEKLQEELTNLGNINKNLQEKLIEYPLLEYQIGKLTKELDVANKRYNNAKITRNTLIKSYENTIKGYIDAIESLKDNNVNIGVELGLLKDRYNNLHELQEQIKTELSEASPDRDNKEYEFINKYFAVTQDYNILSDIVKKHENNFIQLQYKNQELSNQVMQLQDDLKACGTAPGQLKTFKVSFNEFRSKYNDIKQKNDKNLKKITELTDENELLKSKNDNEILKKLQKDIAKLQIDIDQCNEEKNKIKFNLNLQDDNVVLPNTVIQQLPIGTEEYVKENCHGILKTNGIPYKLQWNTTEKKCYMEEIICKEGEMFDDTTQKCNSCKEYNLIWDNNTKTCIQQAIDILEDTNDNIIGYNNDDYWQESKKGRHK